MPWAIALRVVSFPATDSSRKNRLKSMSDSDSPSTSALSRAVMMSSPGSCAALVGELLGVDEHLDLGLEHLLLADPVLRVVGADHPVAPLEDLVAVLARDTDELGDDLERQLGGDVDHEVGLALGEDPVEDLGGEVADVGLHPADHPGREAAVHEPCGSGCGRADPSAA